MIDLGVQAQEMSFACSLYKDVTLAPIQFISFLCCSVGITLAGHYDSPNHLCESCTVQVILFLSAYWLKCYAVQSKELTPTGAQQKMCLVYRVLTSLCQFLIHLESQIDFVSLFLYKNVRQCYVKLYRILCLS